jgi:predicted enzyme related to lactoylglutathione lyase
MPDRKQIPGKFVWFELVAKDMKKAQAFYAETLGWKVQPFPMGNFTYDMIFAGDTMIGGYAAPKSDTQPAHWISYASVEDVDAAAKAATANGGKIVVAPYDAPRVGRMARIADPQGAEISLIKSVTGDAPDAQTAPNGTWVWNELHTTDPTKALAFYESVLGFTYRSMDMGPSGTYHIVSKAGVDRGGVYSSPDAKPYWMPYVAVDDTDATVARAKKLGGTICQPPADIPGVGRFAVLQDPTGATIAVLNPRPREKAA